MVTYMKSSWLKTNSITTFSHNDWSSALGNNILKSYDFIKAVEDSGIKHFDIHYLYSKENSNIRTIIPLFIYNFNLDLLTCEAIKNFAQGIRKRFPNFLKMRILFVGTPIAICDHLIGINGINGDYKDQFRETFKEIKKTSKEFDAKLILFKEIPANETTLLECFKENDIAIGKSLPNSYVLLDDKLGNWMDSFKTRYRRRIKRQIKNADKNKNFNWQFIDDFDEHCEVFEELYQQILNNSNYQFESLNSQFFFNTSTALKENCKALICTNKQSEIVCFELIITQGDTIIPIYLGLDYDYLKDGDLYFSCINKLIQYAEKNNFKKIKFGQTSYQAKAYSGAIFEELILGAYSCNPIIQKIISLFHKQLFQSPPIPAVNVYRKEIISTLESIISKHNIKPINAYYRNNNSKKGLNYVKC